MALQRTAHCLFILGAVSHPSMALASMRLHSVTLKLKSRRTIKICVHLADMLI